MDMSLRPLSKQVVVITGASSGIGPATAKRAAGKGARVVLAARNEPALSRICQEIKDTGGDAVIFVTDEGRVDDLENLAQSALAAFGRIDTWIDNVGASRYGRLGEVPSAASKHAVKGFTNSLRIEVSEIDEWPPGSKLKPEEVAEAILAAAENPLRGAEIGLRAKAVPGRAA